MLERADIGQSLIDYGIFVLVVTRDEAQGVLNKRIPLLLQSGELERHVSVSLDPERSRIMICGNPEMVEDTRGWFVENGDTISRRAKPGHLALENLW